MRKISNTNRKKFMIILPVCGDQNDQWVRLTAQRIDSTSDKINEQPCYSPPLRKTLRNFSNFSITTQ